MTPFVLVVVLGLAACGDGASTTTITSAPETTTSTSVVTTTTSSTTTTIATTTTTVPVSIPVADDDAPPQELLFSLAADGEMVTYQGGFDDFPLTGPQALDVAGDGTIWIADTEALRIIRLDRDGTLLVDIDTDADLVGPVIDLAAHPGGVYALEVVPALDRYRIVSYSEEGEYLRAHDLPDQLHLDRGLTGIEAGGDGQLWIELEGSRRVFAAFAPDGTFAPAEAEGYLAGTTLVAWAEPGGGMARVEVGGEIVTLPVRDTGAVRFQGHAPGVIGVMIEDVEFVEVLLVDVRVVVLTEDARLLAEGLYPLDDVDEVYVPQDFLAMAPDGRMIALVPRQDRVDLVSVTLYAPGRFGG